MPAETPRWLAHHAPEHHDRCQRVGRYLVCRRCLVLYPIAFAVAGLTLALDVPRDLDPWLLFLLPLPAVVELCLEQAGRLRYSAGRQVAVTVPAAVALGRGFARYLDDPGDLAFWAMVIVYGGTCAAFVAWRWLDDNAP